MVRLVALELIEALPARLLRAVGTFVLGHRGVLVPSVRGNTSSMNRTLQVIVGIVATLVLIFYVQKPRGKAHRLERELDLGEKPADLRTPGMPSTEGGGLTHELGGRA